MKRKTTKINKKGKKGDMTSKTIVSVIILVIGFGILLLIFSQIGWTGKIDKEVCYQSVIYRATLPTTLGLKESVPLKCKTEKICITAGNFLKSGDCKEFEGAKGVVKVRVKDIHQIEKTMAESIVDCWSMMGEGRASIFAQWLAGKFAIGLVKPTCVICSRIAFDKESLEKAGIKLEEMNLYNYMKTRLVSGKDYTYYDYLTQGSPAKISLPDKIPDLVIEEEKVEGGEIEIVEKIEEDNKLLTKETAVMFMQISAPGHGEAFGNLFQITALGAFASGPLFFKAVTAKTWWVWVGALVIAAAVQQGSVYKNRAVTAGYCGDVSVGEEARSSCSVVRTINYDAEEISKYCSVIESIP